MNIVITGSSFGIGRAITQHLLDNGHCVIGIARSPQWDISTKYDGQFRFHTLDVSDFAQVSRAAKFMPSTWNAVDALICCAGVQKAAGRTIEVSPAEWTETLRTNLDGTFFAIREFLPQMARSRRPKIVCFSGGGATKVRSRFAAYSASKMGVVRLVETIAAEEPQLDINAVAPGRINTRLVDELLALGPGVIGGDEFFASQQQKSDGGASLQKVIDLVDWLISPASDMTSGKLIAAQWDTWGKK